MNRPFYFAKGALLVAAASVSLFAAPQLAAAQSGDPNYDQGGYNNGQGGTYYDPCARSQANRSVVGGLLGAVAGATLGNSVTHGGAKLGGAIIGGAVGAAAGASIGHATAACQQGQPAPYYAQQGGYPQYGPPPPPPPPPGAYGQNEDDRYAGPPPGAYGQNQDDRYAGPPDRPDYRDAPQGRCQMVEDRVFYPDGTTESTSVQACRDPNGRWHVPN